MDANIGLPATGPYRFRSGAFESNFISQQKGPLGGEPFIPLNGIMTKAGLFRMINPPNKEPALVMTADCVHYLIGNAPKIGGRDRAEVDQMLRDLNQSEREFIAALTHEIMKIYDKVFANEETLRRMEVISPRNELLTSRIETHFKCRTHIEMPEPPHDHFEWVIERTAELLKGKTFLTAKVLHDLDLELRS